MGSALGPELEQRVREGLELQSQHAPAQGTWSDRELSKPVPRRQRCLGFYCAQSTLLSVQDAAAGMCLGSTVVQNRRSVGSESSDLD